MQLMLFKLEKWLTKIRMRYILRKILKKKGYTRSSINHIVNGMSNTFEEWSKYLEE